MPKIDIDAVASEARSGYPAQFNKAIEGRSRKRLGNVVGLDQFGVNLCTLKPGAASSQRHWHECEDEFVHVLAGEVVLIEDGGETILKPGDCAAWKAGVADGHTLVNRGDTDAVLLEIGSRAKAEHVTYPDIDMRMDREDGVSHFLRKNGEAW